MNLIRIITRTYKRRQFTSLTFFIKVKIKECTIILKFFFRINVDVRVIQKAEKYLKSYLKIFFENIKTFQSIMRHLQLSKKTNDRETIENMRFCFIMYVYSQSREMNTNVES